MDVLASIENEKTLLLLKVKQLERMLKSLNAQEHSMKKEMADIDLQIDYYEHLAKDMKKDVHPPKLNSLLTHMKKA
jgi:hypothetical protein